MNKIFNCFSPWGPYSKKYAGISKVCEHKEQAGCRFDFSVAPAIMGFDIKVPNVTLPSSYHPWLSSNDYGFYSFRHDLEWKDVIYADVSYTRLSENSVLVRTELVNNSSIIKNFVVNYFASIELPFDSYTKASFPEKAHVIKALDYESYSYSIGRPWDEQNADGRKKGEFLDNRFTFGKGLGDRAEKWHMPHKVFKPFGAEKGDKVTYKTVLPFDFENAVLTLRYRTSDIKYVQGKQVGVTYINSEKPAVFLINGKTVSLSPCDDPKLCFVELGKLSQGEVSLEFEGMGEGAAEFDFFAVTEKEDSEKIIVETLPINFVPVTEETKELEEGFLTCLEYENVDEKFYLRVFDNNTRFRKIETGALEDCMTARLSNADETFDDVTESFTGAFKRKHSDNGYFHNEISHTIFIEPNSKTVRYAVISDKETDYLSAEEYEKLYLKARKTAVDIKLNSEGEKYKLSNQLLAAAVLTNVVYPIYKHGENIIHHTPGKRWDCLYTWDSGFIGLGMNEYAPRFAEFIIDCYLSEDSNPDYAFLHHGSPVPVQIYQLFEMLQKTNEKEKYLALYDRARLYYLFLCGKIRNSTTGKFKSGILSTYDYFYSTSGMDDYPAQVAMMKNNLRDKASPVISSSQVIRFAKILSIFADKLNKKDDLKEYGEDIERLTEALNKYSWDSESGYFGYVLHDENYEPKKIFTTESGENLNKGLDGIYPIIAAACNEEQNRAILSHLQSEKEMLSPFGISAVDQTASYFKVNGYWNGNIWFPHQWFIWKAMLDCGESDFAFEIAKRALDIWKREVESTYYTFEMVSVVTGCGGWFHNFGGLSTPINLWAKAYFSPGTVNVGFDTWLDSCHFNSEKTALCCKFSCYGENECFTLLSVMKEGPVYKAFVDGKEVAVNERVKGLCEIKINKKDLSSEKVHNLEIFAEKN
ncbi:MAG: hypothetical protein IJ262_10075 [Clostridia bacterium]|nr:hypothetical protein [Clostridia bacterium]